MTQNPDFAWGLIGSMYLGNVMLVVLNVFAIPACAHRAHPRPDHGADRYRAVRRRDFQRERQHRRDLDHAGVRGDRLLHEAVRLLSCGYRRARADSLAEETLRQSPDHLGGGLSIFYTRSVSLLLVIIIGLLIAAPLAQYLQEVDARRPVSSSASAARRSSRWRLTR